jgi:hypothetical protein
MDHTNHTCNGMKHSGITVKRKELIFTIWVLWFD